MKNFLRKGIPLKIFALLLLAAFILALLPMLKAGQYDVPSADDYSNGLDTYRAWERTGSLREVFRTSFKRVSSLYYSWQGTFTAIFLFTLNPMIFGEQYYQIGFYLVLGMLLAGVFVLAFTVWSRIYKAPRHESLIIALVWAILCTQFLPRASQGLYWYVGAVYYTFFFGLAALAYSLLLRYIYRDEGSSGLGKLITATLLLFLVGGGNLVTGLTTAVLLATMELLLVLRHNKAWKPLLIPAFAFYAAFLINVSAPGNAVRQNYFAQPGLISSVFISFEEMGKFALQWFSLPVLALMVMLIPVFWRIASRYERRFPLPGLVSLYSICLSGVMFYAPVYAMTAHNLDHLGRITNIIFFGMMFLAMFNLYYWIGWLYQHGRLTENHFAGAAKGRYSLACLLLTLLLFGFGMTQIKWFDVTSISAFRSYRSGEMGSYYHTYKGRLEILKDPEVKDAVLKRYPCRPYVLYFQDLSPSAAKNRVIAEWYEKDSVVIR